jgi:hypothetical protein
VPKLIDLTGQQFGRLTALRYEDGKWVCKCKCGNVVAILSGNLRAGRTLSCGCQKRDSNIKKNYVHGHRKERIYGIYHKILDRTTNKNDKAYKNYGGRGIGICKEWKNDFETFRKWALENGYTEELTIDRIDNNKGYSPENCRWTTRKVQNNNTRRNHFITYKGQTKTLAQWAEEKNINVQTLISRINESKWSVEKALETPVKKKHCP